MAVLNVSDAGMNLAGHLVYDGRITLPDHAVFRLPRHSRIVYDGRRLIPTSTKRSPQTGFFEPANLAQQIYLPPSFTHEIEAALSSFAPVQMRIKDIERALVLRQSPDEIRQYLSDWQLQISKNAEGGCVITLAAALKAEREDPVLRKVVNHWPVDGQSPRVKIRFSVNAATRALCHQNYTSKRKFNIDSNHYTGITSRSLVYPYLSSAYRKYAALGDHEAEIGPESMWWPFAMGRTMAVRGFGKTAVDAALSRASSFQLVLQGRDLGGVGTRRDDYEAGELPPRHERVAIKGSLCEEGLALTFWFGGEGDGRSSEHDVTLPWTTLLLRRFGAAKHLKDFAGEP